MSVGEEPFLVEPGWLHMDFIRNYGGPTYRLLTYPDGAVRFEHRCWGGDGRSIIAAPTLCIGPHAEPGRVHTLTYNDAGKPTVAPSIECGCGTHGFVTDGFWSGNVRTPVARAASPGEES